MAVVASIFSGLEGSSEVHPHSLIPSTGFSYKQEGNRNPMNVADYSPAPMLFPPSIDYSSRRAVLPCKGITHQVLRSPPVPSTMGMVASSGIGRHQSKGLAYSAEKPINLPIMPYSNPFASGTNNKLGHPA
jgi:hypothetical protein